MSSGPSYSVDKMKFSTSSTSSSYNWEPPSSTPTAGQQILQSVTNTDALPSQATSNMSYFPNEKEKGINLKISEIKWIASIFIGIIAGVVVGGITVYKFSWDIQSQIDANKSEIRNLKTNFDNASRNIEKNYSKIDKIDELDKEVVKLQFEVKALEALQKNNSTKK